MSKFKMIRESQLDAEKRNPLTKTILDTAEGLMEAGVMDNESAEEIARTLTEMGGPAGLMSTLRFRAQAEEEESMQGVEQCEQEEEWTQLEPDQEEQIVDMTNMQLHRQFPKGNYVPQDVVAVVLDILDDVPGLEDQETAQAVANRLGRKIFHEMQKDTLR